MKTSLLEYQPDSGWQQESTDIRDTENTLILIFSNLPRASISEPILQLREKFPHATFMGCSSAGEIFDARFIEEGLVAAAIEFEHSQLLLHCLELSEEIDSFSIGESLATRLNNRPNLGAVFILSEGLNINASRLMLGINAVLEGKIPVTGGLAGDGSRFESTWVLHQDKTFPNTVCALGIYGQRLGVAYGSKGGWDVLGPERRVSRSHGNVLYELDGQPALSLYKKYLGDRAAGLPATGLLFPLAIRTESEQHEQKVRTILGVDEAQQSLTFAGDIPQNSQVQLMRANFDRLIDGAEDAADTLDLRTYAGAGLCCIAISCVGRHLVLGPRVEEEIEAVRESLPQTTCQIGFYSYGELSPLASGLCDLHNQTMTLTLWWER